VIAPRLTAAALVAAAAAAATAVPGPSPAYAASTLGVTAHDFYFTVSRLKVDSGMVTVELRNDGEDDHNLVVKRNDGTGTPVEYDVATPGATSEKTFRMQPGEYRLICTLDGHKALGMKTTIRVRSG